ncbi:alpha/beta fold hydrolase [Rhodococcus baikonurensis]
MTIWNELAGLDFELTTVDAGGVPTRSLQAGSGDEAVIFLHGTSGHLEAFARNIAPHAESYRVHAIDMLGHGYTGKPDYPYEIPRYVEHLVNYLDAVGLDRVHLVGESLGGWVAAYLASEQPERVLSLQLLAAGGTVANPVVMERIKTSTAKAVQSDDIELTRARMQLLMHDPADATEELVQARHRIYHQPDFVANIHNLLSCRRWRFASGTCCVRIEWHSSRRPLLWSGARKIRSVMFRKRRRWPRIFRALSSNSTRSAVTGRSTSRQRSTTR